MQNSNFMLKFTSTLSDANDCLSVFTNTVIPSPSLSVAEGQPIIISTTAKSLFFWEGADFILLKKVSLL